MNVAAHRRSAFKLSNVPITFHTSTVKRGLHDAIVGPIFSLLRSLRVYTVQYPEVNDAKNGFKPSLQCHKYNNAKTEHDDDYDVTLFLRSEDIAKIDFRFVESVSK